VPGYSAPKIPVILTKADWDKKKGVIAKMAGATGIGAECDKVAAAYKAVNWTKLDLIGRSENEMQNWRNKNYSKDYWDKIVAEGKAEMVGNLTKLSVALQKLRDTCTKAAAEFKKSRTIPASSTAHVTQMAKTADQLSVSWNKNSMTVVLQNQIKEFDKINDRLFGQVVPSLRKVAMDQRNLVADMRADPTPANFNKLVGTVRNLTQSVGNYAKMAERGFAPPNPAAVKAAKDLVPWASADDVKVAGNASTQQVTAAIDKLAGPHRAAIVVAAGA
jgi:hypothetical protein